MQIINLKISNIESFWFVPNLNQIEWITFATKETWNTNIIIWPNGSGKSSVLEILNQIIKIWIQQDYIYDKNDFQFPIQELNHCFQHLAKHFSYQNKPSHFYIKLFLTQQDISNLHFISKYYEQINSYIKKYSWLDLKFEPIDLSLLEFQNTFSLFGTFDFLSKQIIIRKRKFSKLQSFVLNYLRHHELLKIVFHLMQTPIVPLIRGKISGNNTNSNTDQISCPDKGRLGRVCEKSPSLWNPFAVLWAKRDFDRQLTYQDTFTDQELDIKTQKTNTKTILHWWLWYLLVAKKLRKIIRKNWFQNMLKHSFFQDINDIFKQYLNLRLFVKYNQDKVFLYIKKQTPIVPLIRGKISGNYTNPNIEQISCPDKGRLGKVCSSSLLAFNQLSSWEESFALLILTVFWYELYNGTMLIDEPELHLHPQSQQLFLKLLQSLQNKFHVQFILSTHSPVFVSAKTLKNTTKLSNSRWETVIYNCKQWISSSEHNLMHMLKYWNVAKMFFVDKILMVEGETDLYFFSHYLKYLQNTKKRSWIIKDYEIIDIWWKWSFKKRQKLLLKFWILSYYIWDWDNILDSAQDNYIYKYRSIVHSHNQKYRKYHAFHKTQTYWKLIEYLRDYHKLTYNRFANRIKLLYSDNVFLLEKWDLETYIWLNKKWIWPTVDFCNHDFLSWVVSEHFVQHRKELEKIILKMFW